MGRAGSGSRSSVSRSSSGHSSNSRSSSGHHVGSSRAGSSGRSRSSYTSSMGHSYSVRHTPGPRYYGPGYGYRGGGPRVVVHTGFFWVLPWLIFVVAILIAVAMSRSGDIPASTQNRDKLNLGIGFNNDCVVDEIDWVYNPSGVAKLLQSGFYEKTGVQPYVVFHRYDPSLVTDDDKELWAQEYYERNIDNEGTFLYVYFAEEDTDTNVGYMTTVNGREVSTVMDAEAINIFWAYIDQEWYGDGSTDELLVTAFKNTANRIMDKGTTWTDVFIFVVIAIIVIACAYTVIHGMKLRRQHEKERNEEVANILNADLNESDDPVVAKYVDEDDGT